MSTAPPWPTRSPGPQVKVIDFGIARAAGATMTRSGLRLGTPSWMAPEQLRDRPAGPPADVLAWGLLVAFAAAGRHPFGGGPADAVAYRILHDRPDLDGVPEPLRPLVRGALARDPAARPTAARLATVLTAAVAPTVPLPVTGPTLLGPALPLAARRPTRRPRRRPRLDPHVVLAAVAGPDDPATRQSAEHCPCDDERSETRDPDDEDEEEDERDEETEMEDAGQDRDAGESPGDGGCDGKVSPGAGQPHRTSAPRPPPSTRPSPPPAPAAPVLGS